MRTARALGVTPDGAFLLVVTDDGEQVRVEAGERLMAALRGDRARLGQLEIEMDSALKPRDIQARIRAGESPQDVARAAGVPEERIAAFAAPVIAEREHVAGLAQTHPVRRRGETTSHRVLRNAVSDALASRSVDPATMTWDAWKLEDRRWQVRLTYTSGSAAHEALFVYDQNGRFTTASNDDARWLIGEPSSVHGPQPGRRPADRSRSATPALDDDLAIVRALRPSPASPTTPEGVESPASPSSPASAASRTSATPVDEDEDAFQEAELTEVDGVYDLVRGRQSDLDVLYEMLSSFDEDSVKIYSGLLTTPRGHEPVVIVDAAPADAPEEVPATAASAEAPQENPDADDATQDDADDPAIEGDLTDAEFTIETPALAPSPTEPEQLSLIDEIPAPPQPVRPKSAKRRASVPSWDEIMFGSPHKDA